MARSRSPAWRRSPGTQGADPAQADTRGLDATLERLHVDRQLDGLSPAAPTAAVFGLDDTTI